MVNRRDLMRVSEAIEKLMLYSYPGKKEYVAIEDSYRRFLAEDIIADHDVPRFDRSPYDGFAIRSSDTKEASRDNPVTLSVVGEIGAGSIFKQQVKHNQAVRIMTGAQIPTGCDAVIMLELVKEQRTEAIIRIKRKIEPNDNISFQAEDTRKGTVIAKKGTAINPGVVALLAAFGYKNVPVSVRPKVGVIATGSELLTLDEPLVPGKIRNSNSYMIQAQLERVGAETVYFGQFSNDIEVCFEQVKDTIKQVDFLITTGGVSVGDYDYLPAIYRKLEATVLFNKVGMRPGSVTTVAEVEGKLLFGLSGNPSACFVGFELFVRPVTRTFLSDPKPFPKAVKAVLGADFLKPNPFDRYVRASTTYQDTHLVATPVGLDKSNVVSSLGSVDVLIVLPGGTRGYQAGEKVWALLLDGDDGDTSYQNPR